ncbi:MAG: DHH family phosphoesterase [Clostridiales bacterium]|nr:DHH family phosphoesterase [Clostridiales bacterium]
MKNNGLQSQLNKLRKWPIYLIPFLAFWTVLEFWINFYAGIVMIALDISYILFFIWWILQWNSSISQSLVHFAQGFHEEQKDQLTNLPVPYAVFDGEGDLFWSNHAFDELVPEGLEGDETVAHLLPYLSKNLPQDQIKKSEHIQWNDRAYQADIQRISLEEPLYSLFLFDETSHLAALKEIEEQKSVIGQVYIDNYEEVMNSAETVRQSLLAALIERKINKYFANYDGVVRKTEKDKFIVFMRKKSLLEIQEDRFSVLEDVKTLNIGNNIAVTLSISMGTDGGSMEQNNEYSRNAMDLALGRGGDQAIVKTPEYTKYYGGKTQQQEKNTRVKARVKAQALRELMVSRDQILIMGHKIPDMDSFGAAVGIYRAAATLGKRVHIVMNELSSSIKPMIARFQNNSEYPADLIINNEKALTLLDGNTIVIVVDVNRPSYTECSALLDKAATIVVLDHHRQGGETVRKATLSYIEPYASSASEMVAEILQYFNDNMKIRPIEAESLYAGIVMDTDNFVNKTGVRTFEAAAFLRRHGADVTRVRKLFREKIEDSKAKAITVSNVEMFEDCFAFSICPGDGIESPTIVGAEAANALLDIIGVKASFVFTEFNDTIYISARSIDEVNVQLIMERLGGGGHLSIAGAQLKNCTAEEAKEKVQETLLEMLEEGAI